jgi:sucrose-6-phosphate hydrolase SacC (GH32 family)
MQIETDDKAQFIDLGPDFYAARTNPSARSASTSVSCRPWATR